MPRMTLLFDGKTPTSCAECPLYDNNSQSVLLCHGDGFEKIPDNCPVCFEPTLVIDDDKLISAFERAKPVEPED